MLLIRESDYFLVLQQIIPLRMRFLLHCANLHSTYITLKLYFFISPSNTVYFYSAISKKTKQGKIYSRMWNLKNAHFLKIFLLLLLWNERNSRVTRTGFQGCQKFKFTIERVSEIVDFHTTSFSRKKRKFFHYILSVFIR